MAQTDKEIYEHLNKQEYIEMAEASKEGYITMGQANRRAFAIVEVLHKSPGFSDFWDALTPPQRFDVTLRMAMIMTGDIKIEEEDDE